MIQRLILLGLMCIIITGCAGSTKSKVIAEEPASSGKFDSFNRTMFNFNYHVLDPYVVRPVAVVWRDHVPRPARTGLSNALSNLSEPSTMVNYLLEGDVNRAAKHFTRFMLNSILGLGGLIDVAGKANPELAQETQHRLGSTLGHYGVGYGPYITLPGYGSFTPRQDGASLVDNAYPPLGWLTWWFVAGKWVLQGVETRAQLLDSDAILKQQQDPYAFVRSAYFQRYDFLARGGKLQAVDNPNAEAIESNLDEIDAN